MDGFNLWIEIKLTKLKINPIAAARMSRMPDMRLNNLFICPPHHRSLNVNDRPLRFYHPLDLAPVYIYNTPFYSYRL